MNSDGERRARRRQVWSTAWVGEYEPASKQIRHRISSTSSAKSRARVDLGARGNQRTMRREAAAI